MWALAEISWPKCAKAVVNITMIKYAVDCLANGSKLSVRSMNVYVVLKAKVVVLLAEN